MLSASAISTTDFFFLSRITNVTSRRIALAQARRSDNWLNHTEESYMNTRSKIVIAAVAGAAFGAAAVQGLHAQANLKAYSVSESEQIGTAPPDYLAKVRKAIEVGHGRALRTLNGRVVSIEGA